MALRRLTSQQYTQSIHDVLGEDIVVASRVEPDARLEGLLGVGASFVSVTPSGFEKYEAAATAIAEQALSSELRGAILSCEALLGKRRRRHLLLVSSSRPLDAASFGAR